MARCPSRGHAADPEGELAGGSAAVRSRFLLVKVLAADEPLSLQAHPSGTGGGGLPAGGPRRPPGQSPSATIATAATNPNCWWRSAISRRSPDSRPAAFGSADATLAVPALDPFIALFRRPVRLRRTARVVHHLDHCAPTRHRRPESLRCWRCRRLISVPGAGEFADEARTILELGERYPATRVSWLHCCSTRIALTPGSGIFLPAGNLHSYL